MPERLPPISSSFRRSGSAPVRVGGSESRAQSVPAALAWRRAVLQRRLQSGFERIDDGAEQSGQTRIIVRPGCELCQGDRRRSGLIRQTLRTPDRSPRRCPAGCGLPGPERPALPRLPGCEGALPRPAPAAGLTRCGRRTPGSRALRRAPASRAPGGPRPALRASTGALPAPLRHAARSPPGACGSPRRSSPPWRR